MTRIAWSRSDGAVGGRTSLKESVLGIVHASDAVWELVLVQHRLFAAVRCMVP